MIGVFVVQLLLSLGLIGVLYRKEISVLRNHQSAILLSHKIRLKALHTAKSRVWAHWLFWLITPFGSSISCTRTRHWSPFLVAVFIAFLGVYLASVVEAKQGYDLQGYWLLSANWSNIVGATLSTMQIWVARKRLGIVAATDAEKLIMAERSTT